MSDSWEKGLEHVRNGGKSWELPPDSYAQAAALRREFGKFQTPSFNPTPSPPPPPPSSSPVSYAPISSGGRVAYTGKSSAYSGRRVAYAKDSVVYKKPNTFGKIFNRIVILGVMAAAAAAIFGNNKSTSSSESAPPSATYNSTPDNSQNSGSQNTQTYSAPDQPAQPAYQSPAPYPPPPPPSSEAAPAPDAAAPVVPVGDKFTGSFLQTLCGYWDADAGSDPVRIQPGYYSFQAYSNGWTRVTDPDTGLRKGYIPNDRVQASSNLLLIKSFCP